MRVVLAPLIGVLLACGGSSAAPDCTLEPTPGGLVPRECIHEVPSGGTVTTTDGGTLVVTVDGRVVATYGPCPCPRPDGG